MSEKKKVMSAIQPTGNMHIGNYFGAVKNWVDLQKEYDCVYGVMNYHAMTMPYDMNKLRQNTWEILTNLVAVGVEPSNLFVQSLIPEHAELCWIFDNFCSFGELQRMTQFKDKSKNDKNEGFVSAGLLNYPVLQVADILIYKADYVPIGKDQEQHLELTRNIAQRFNSQVGKEYFVLPESLYTETPKIKSTADPSKKMSKSAGEKHHITVFGDLNRVKKQIKSAVTDAGDTPEGTMSAGVENLFQIMKACDAHDACKEQMEAYESGKLRYSDLKEEVTKALIPMLERFNDRKKELNSDKRALKSQIKESSAQIRLQAQETLKEVKDLVGLINVKF